MKKIKVTNEMLTKIEKLMADGKAVEITFKNFGESTVRTERIKTVRWDGMIFTENKGCIDRMIDSVYEIKEVEKTMNAIKVFAYEAYHGGTISEAEAAEEGINTDGLELATLDACKAQVADGDIGNAYGGPIEVAEGFFEFDFDKVAYMPFRKEGE